MWWPHRRYYPGLPGVIRRPRLERQIPTRDTRLNLLHNVVHIRHSATPSFDSDRRPTLRRKWFAVAAVATALIPLGVQAAAASSTQLSHFETIDGTFAKADHTWTAALLNLGPNPTVAQISKPSLAFVPAIKTFDTALLKIGFSGKTASAVASAIKLNGELIADISSMKSTKTFISEFSALNSKYLGVQTSLAKDLGIATADVQV
jgi:hypothetical protein